MCCPAKLAPALSSPTADDRTARGAGSSPTAASRAATVATSPEAMESTSGPGRATPGGTGSPARRASPRPDGLRAVQLLGVRFDQRHDPVHSRTVTVPSSPSTRTRVPSAMRSVASRVPTTPGMPYSREMIAAWDRAPPLSVMIALSSGSRMLNASVVASVSRTSPCWIRSKSLGTGDATDDALPGAGAGAEPADHRLLVGLLGDREHLAQGRAQGRHQPGHRWRERRQVGHRGRRRRPGAPGRPSRCRSCGTRAARRARRPSAPPPRRPGRTSRRRPRTRCPRHRGAGHSRRADGRLRARRDASVQTPRCRSRPRVRRARCTRSGPPRAARRTPSRCSSGTWLRTSAISWSTFDAAPVSSIAVRMARRRTSGISSA